MNRARVIGGPFSCPCGGTWTAVELEGGDGAALHSMPQCARFDRMEPDDFAHWVRTGCEVKGCTALHPERVS